jgi:hypothetical protein
MHFVVFVNLCVVYCFEYVCVCYFGLFCLL